VFEFENKWNPDVDDTAMVLLALRQVPTDRPARARRVFQARPRLDDDLPVQGRRLGGLRQGLHQEHPRKVPFADHNAMLDPECADITARILELLGYEGLGLDHPQVQKALEYIRANRRRTAPGTAAGASITSTAPGRSCADCAP
jgi:squalene-hopene/tetraprenyl-beta-curcumene cyclase